jgi:hypothetical protein
MRMLRPEASRPLSMTDFIIIRHPERVAALFVAKHRDGQENIR